MSNEQSPIPHPQSHIPNPTSPIPHPQSHIPHPTSQTTIRHLPLIIILTLFSALTLYQSIILPIGEAADETDHYQYLRFVARTGHPPFTQAERDEAGFKGGLAPLYYWLTAWPIAIIGEDTPPDIRRVDARPQRYIPTDGLGLNHVMHTLDEAWPWRGQTLAWHIIRFFSWPMGLMTIIATYALARHLVPESNIVATGAAAFVAFLPRFVISSAVINDDNLVFALTALLLLTQVIILKRHQPPSIKLMIIFGALFGLALITKYFSLILIPEIILTLWFIIKVSGVRYQVSSTSPHISPSPSHISHPTSHIPHRASRIPFLPLLAFLMALFVTAGPWFIFIIRRFNRIDELGFIPGLAASLGEPQITEGLVGVLSGQSVRPVAATYTFTEWLSLVYRSFWFEYGWMQIFAPRYIYLLFTLFILIVLIGLIWKTWNNKFVTHHTNPDETSVKRRILHNTKHAIRNTSCTTRLLTLHLALFAAVLIIRYILSATIDTGQGRHLYPALPVIALLVSLGLAHFGFTIWDFRLNKLTHLTNRLPAIHRLLPAIGYLLPATLFLIPAAISLFPSFTIYPSPFTLRHSPFILPHYRTIPASASPMLLPIEQRQSIEFDRRVWLVGLNAPASVSAGDALPVTLHWFAEEEVNRDYLVSLCLHDDRARSAACWRGHFDDGHYPARAWERGDTLADTIHIPIPACYRLTDQPYTLHLEVWALDSTAPVPTPLDPPLLQHTFTQPKISITPTDSLTTRPQTVEVWHTGSRITSAFEVQLNQSLTQITYAAHSDTPPSFQNAGSPDIRWPPQFNTSLHLPCDDGPAPFAQASTFLVNPTLPGGNYQLTMNNEPLPITATLSLRDRMLAPITSTLSFSHTLSPLNIQLSDQSAINLTRSTRQETPLPITNYQLPITTLPITIRWHAQRRMAEPLIIALKLLDKDFAVGGEHVAALGGRYPNVLWAPTEIIDETYPLNIKADAPPGLYVLEMSLLRRDEALPDGFEYLPVTGSTTQLGHNLYPTTLRLLDPNHATPPSHRLEARLGEAIRLTGYDINPVFSDPPERIELALYWQSTEKMVEDYTVFTQLLGPDGQVWAQWDNPPQAGRYPTTAWATNDTIVDRYILSLKEGAPAGDYRLLAGMYNSATGERLPVTINGRPQPNNAVELTTVTR